MPLSARLCVPVIQVWLDFIILVRRTALVSELKITTPCYIPKYNIYLFTEGCGVIFFS